MLEIIGDNTFYPNRVTFDFKLMLTLQVLNALFHPASNFSECRCMSHANLVFMFALAILLLLSVHLLKDLTKNQNQFHF